MDNKRKLYWLKLKEDFFRNKEIKKLRSIAGGDTYTIIYQKMQLLSLKNGGELFFDGVEDSFTDEIALEIDEDPENVKVTVMYLIKNGLLEEVDANKYILWETKECIGSESGSASRVRKHRTLKNQQKLLQCNTSVTICNTDIDIEKDIDKRTIYNTIETIVEHLNQKTGAKFKPNSTKTARLIKTRLNESYELNDFIVVIDKKVQEWLGTDYSKYLRPETLFGPKFESYLNAPQGKSSNRIIGKVPEWLDKQIEKETTTISEKAQLEEILQEFKK